ncbi:MAG TPA: LysM peptidoglycan-binding domain-containing protein [Rectinemataceae bacterium]|nr:LysM peptidoglycan-binding domain-containing protein [Rectinemataceae bacterium]
MIARGETLYSVARSYGISASLLQAANGIADPSRLRVGQRILIPGIHRVEKGDTLYSIAKSAGSTVAELRKLNGLSASALLHVGDILLLPSSEVAAQPGTLGRDPASSSGSDKVASSNPDATAQKSPVSTLSTPDPVTSLPAHPRAARNSSANDLPCGGAVRYLDGKVYGIAIRSSQGAEVHSVTDGYVVSAGPYRGFGSVVFVQTRTGLIYVYGGNARLDVKVGDRVHRGQILGRVGSDAFTGATDAYFFVFKGSKALDPATAPRG